MINRRLVMLTGLAATACAKAPGGAALNIGATAVPHAEILEFIRPQLAKQGVDLKIKVFNDYVQPNLQVDQKQLDCSYFETKPYMDAFNQERGTKLVTVIGVHVEPLGGYSRRFKSIEQLPDGALVAVPNDTSNAGRALFLLQHAGLIGLRDPHDIRSTPRDVVSNPKKLVFRELESATLPRVLDQVDLALINTNYALDAKLDPLKDALIREDKNSPYVNYLVARPDNKDDPRIAALAKILTSPQVRDFINGKYRGAVLPAF